MWAEEEYAKLPPYDENPGPVAAFLCHQQDGRLCAGWVGCHDMENSVALRMAAAYGRITIADVEAARDYVSPIPLWGSGAEAAAHGLAEVDRPGPKAQRTIDKLERKRRN